MLLAEAGTQASGGNIFYTFVFPLVLMFAVFYFLLIRPQQKKQKARNLMLGDLKKGDKVITIGGLHGSIFEITDDKVVLQINDATKMTFDRSAVNGVKTD
ncbi:preprotein translocase subunit YajC [Chengkuizengella sediminis]|uniref:preprotein translocase subunit YajC n=1 Tax=Chengkuizengella sediminis TaxID=1885917 RepID=UPI00138A5182|nr:preprotein translocase subunit YajC [Chengkuizengella sediminis]NDI34002.1 preprotein translocase subunit YajC [Chengkuizengella sediminis]